MASLDLRALAFAHRLAIWGALAGFIAVFTHGYAMVPATLFMLFCAWRVTRAGGFGVPATLLWLILMLIPLVNILALILLSHRAAVKLRAAGIPVGLFGVSSTNIPPPKDA